MIGKVFFKEGNSFYQFIEFIKSLEQHKFFTFTFNKDDQQIIFRSMDKKNNSILLITFNNATVNANPTQLFSIKRESFNLFTKKFKKSKKPKEFELKFTNNQLEIIEKITDQKVKIPMDTDKDDKILLSNLKQATETYGIFQFKFNLFIEILKNFGNFSSIIVFKFLKDKLTVSESGDDGNCILSFPKTYFTKYILPEEDSSVYGGFMWDDYLENYIKLEDTDLIIEDLNYSHKTKENLKLEFLIDNLNIDYSLFIAPEISDETKKIEEHINLKQKAEALNLRFVRNKMLGISLMEEEELKEIMDTIKKYPSKEESEVLEARLEDLDKIISLKLKPLIKEAVKTFLIHF